MESDKESQMGSAIYQDPGKMSHPSINTEKSSTSSFDFEADFQRDPLVVADVRSLTKTPVIPQETVIVDTYKHLAMASIPCCPILGLAAFYKSGKTFLFALYASLLVLFR